MRCCDQYMLPEPVMKGDCCTCKHIRSCCHTSTNPQRASKQCSSNYIVYKCSNYIVDSTTDNKAAGD
jgi:hypothetical protein